MTHWHAVRLKNVRQKYDIAQTRWHNTHNENINLRAALGALESACCKIANCDIDAESSRTLARDAMRFLMAGAGRYGDTR
jgi:hypothetical protein